MLLGFGCVKRMQHRDYWTQNNVIQRIDRKSWPLFGSNKTGHDLGQGNLLFYAPEYIAKKTKKPYISLIHKVFYSFLLLLSKKPGAENGTRTRDLNLGKVALSSPQNAARLGVTNWSISFYDDFLECVLPCFSHWLNGWLNICVCLLVCKWLLIKELFNGLNKFCNTFFLVIHWHSEFIVFK